MTSTYHARGMVTSRLSPNGTETMTYDGTANRMLYQSTSGTRFTSVYDAAGQETTLTFGSKTHLANYDSVGQPTTQTYDSGTVVKRAYDARGYMTTLVQDSLNGVVTYASTYDGAGRKTVSSRNGVLSTNTYDSDDRLTVQNRPGAVASYTYDQDTNLTSRHHQGQNIVTFTNNTFGQVTTQIQGAAVTTYTWDGAGRNTNEDDGIDAANRTWDQVGRMTAQKLGTSEVTRNFSYQHDNLRYRASEGATISTYVWDSGDLRRVIGADSNDFAVFNGQIVEGVDSEFLSDELGHITAWGSAASSQWEELEYWPYGELQSGTLPPEGLGYMGADSVMRKWIPELLYAQQRWLKPGAGRFLSVDPYWPSELAYMYVEGMPTMAVDAIGLQKTGQPAKAGAFSGASGKTGAREKPRGISSYAYCSCDPPVAHGIKKYPKSSRMGQCLFRACIEYCTSLDEAAAAARASCEEYGTIGSFFVSARYNNSYPICNAADEYWQECGLRITVHGGIAFNGAYANHSNYPYYKYQDGFGTPYCPVECTMRLCCASLKASDPKVTLRFAFNRCRKMHG